MLRGPSSSLRVRIPSSRASRGSWAQGLRAARIGGGVGEAHWPLRAPAGRRLPETHRSCWGRCSRSSDHSSGRSSERGAGRSGRRCRLRFEAESLLAERTARSFARAWTGSGCRGLFPARVVGQVQPGAGCCLPEPRWHQQGRGRSCRGWRRARRLCDSLRVSLLPQVMQCQVPYLERIWEMICTYCQSPRTCCWYKHELLE